MNPQCNKILNILSDGEYHCPQEWNYGDGHCRRFTDLKQNGYVIESKPCNCGRHTSRVLMRRLVAKPGDYKIQQWDMPKLRKVAGEIKEMTAKEKGPCCYSYSVFGTHDPKCVKGWEIKMGPVKQLSQQVGGLW